MDEELRTYLDAMRREFYDAQQLVLQRIAALQREFRNTKGFLVNNAIQSRRRPTD